MGISAQADWGAGIYRGREAPENAAYDLLNCLIDDEGQPFRRGGAVYKSNAAAAGTLLGIADVLLSNGQATLYWRAGQFLRLQAGDDATPVSLSTTAVPRSLVRGAAVGTTWLAPSTTSAQMVSYDGTTATLVTAYSPTVASNLGTWSEVYATTVGSPPRLVLAGDTYVYFSAPGDATNIADADYHQLPQRAKILGADSLEDTAIVFTTAGIWLIDQMTFDPVDDVGNVQHRVRQVNEIVAWGDPGVAKYQNTLVVPALDGVYLIDGAGGLTNIGDGIRPLLQSYLKLGYQPGLAATHRGHYFLPVLNGTTMVDLLVCRLDRGAAWTRWSGFGAGIGFARRVGASTRTPKLLAVSGTRVIELTDAWAPSASNASEADATTHTVTIETRDLSTPSGAKGATTRKVKVRYEATAAAGPTFTVSYARGPEGASYTSLGTAIRGGSTSDGLDESVWPVGKQAPAIRFKITSSSALSTFTLRSVSAEYGERGA